MSNNSSPQRSSVKRLAAGLFFARREKSWEPYFKNLLAKEVAAFNQRWSAKTTSNSDTLSKFQRIRTLGTGGFGRVMLVKENDKNNFYAMKILKKEKVVSLHQVEHTINEKRILASCNSPFLVHMLCSHKDNSYLYFVMEFVSGGEMFTLLRRMKKFPEAMAQFYSAQVVLAFEYLHAVNIVYRDLKPENLLIDNRGYVRVTDMGLAKRLKTNCTYTMCGTPEYLAPEVIQSKGYGKGVDWWALGILIFEMIVGQVPFYSSNHMAMYTKIVSGVFRMPPSFGERLRDLLRNLIQVDWTQRFGCMKAGVADIKQHKWYSVVDWIAMYERKLPAPYIPQCAAPGDASNFEEYEEENLDVSSVVEYPTEFQSF